MTKLDAKTLNALKLAQAQSYQNFFASDVSWNAMVQTHLALSWILSNRAKMQPLAKRYEKNPIRFCEKIMRRGWFEPPTEGSTRQLQTLLQASPIITEFLTAPHVIEDLNARHVIKMLHTLAARPAGRKRAEIYARATALRQSGIDFHRICIDLIPNYKNMSAPERRTKRDAMRAGVTRLRKAMVIAQGATKSRA